MARRSTAVRVLGAGCVAASLPLFVQPAGPSARPEVLPVRGALPAAAVAGVASSAPAVAAAGFAVTLLAAAQARRGSTARRAEKEAAVQPEATKVSPPPVAPAPAAATPPAAAAPAAAAPVAAAPSAAPAAWDPAKEIGSTAPLGFFDPAGLAKDEKKFRSYRTAELKHGRVAMMAAIGAVVQHSISLPGFDDAPRGIEATASPQGFIGAIALVGLAGYLETGIWKQDANKEVGNFGDPLGLSKSIGKYDAGFRNRELNNGRFAMLAALGIIVAEQQTGKDAVEQILGV